MKHLFGPVSREFADQNLLAHVRAGTCRTFDHGEEGDLPLKNAAGWEEWAAGFPADWRPECLVLHLQYRSIPSWMWQAPVPIVGLAGDWNLQWHWYRRVLPRCDLVLADRTGTEALHRQGIAQARSAILYGCERQFLEDPFPAVERDIDVLFVGNFHPAVQAERLPFLGRVARLGTRYRVVLATGIFGRAYRDLLARARIVFNRSIRGEANNRAFESLAAGALLFQEKGNREVPTLLREGEEFIAYDDEDLEERLIHYLEREEDRAAIAAAGRARSAEFSFERFWTDHLERIARELQAQTGHSRNRIEADPIETGLTESLEGTSSLAGPDARLPAFLRRILEDHPRSSLLQHALGLTTTIGRCRNPALAAEAFRTAWTVDPGNVAAGLSLARILAEMPGHRDAAGEQALQTLRHLEDFGTGTDWLDLLPCTHGFDGLRVAWERAAWGAPGDSGAERKAKIRLIRWALHVLLGSLTGRSQHFQEASASGPDLATVRSHLGQALEREGHPEAARHHLELALAANPFDGETARHLNRLLGISGRGRELLALAEQRRTLHRAAPGLVPEEPWFAPTPTLLPPVQPQRRRRIVWQGAIDANHSLAVVNRELCRRLADRGHELLLPAPGTESPEFGKVALPEDLRQARRRNLSGPPDVVIHHRWPPDFQPPPAGRWVVVQPWEYGSLPVSWVDPLNRLVDQVWVPSRFVRNGFVQSGVDPERVRVVPHGVDQAFFRSVPVFPLLTRKTYRFLFVGGTIERKGIDLLLQAYGQVFSSRDDVCLVIKDMGVGTFYKGQTAEELLDRFRYRNDAPEIEYLRDDLSQEEMVSLYRSCHCLVHPFRAEGFGLPMIEAMAAGLPVVATGFGPTLDFCTPETAYLLPFRVEHFPQKRCGPFETVDRPFWAHPDSDALRFRLRRVFEDPEAARQVGLRARKHVADHFTWDHAIRIVEDNLQLLDSQPLRRSYSGLTASSGPGGGGPAVSLCMIVRNEEANLPQCLASVQGLFAEMVVVDTGSTDATKALAEKAGARVFDFPWVDDFAAARNECLRHATGEWIFWMDADDRLEEDNRRKLMEVLRALPGDNIGFVMKCLCLPDPAAGLETQVDHVRLFRNHPSIRWEFRIHEQILPSIRRLGGTVRWCPVTIHHVGYRDPELRRRKLERDLRILKLEIQERPDHPFPLFNLGSVHYELGDLPGALEAFRRSLQGSQPTDSITRKLYAMIAHCQRRLNDPVQALETCRAGLVHCPDDPEILFQEALLLRASGNPVQAESAIRKVLNLPREHEFFASVDTGLQTYKARHLLASILKDQGRREEAEVQWRELLGMHDGFLPAWLGLADLLLDDGRRTEMQAVMDKIVVLDRTGVEHRMLQARRHLAERHVPGALETAEALVAEHPRDLRCRTLLAQVLLEGNGDPQKAEEALLAVLDLAPEDPDARSHLEMLRRRRSDPTT